MGSVIVSSFRCFMFVSCVHPVSVLNAAFCLTCSLLMLLEDARGEYMDLWTYPAGVRELLARWRDKLACGPEAG